MEYEIYNGQFKIKLVGEHIYYVANKEKSGWGQWQKKYGITTIGSIKDKSAPLKYWVAKIMAKFLCSILDKRGITKYDVDEARTLHTKYLKEAGTIGTKIHDWIEEYIKGKKPEMPEEKNVIIGVNGFLDWVKKNKVKFIESETFIYSRQHDFSGRLDAIAIIDGKRYLIDYKTGTGLYNDVLLQTAAYAGAYQEMTGNKINGRWAIRIEKRDENEFRADMDEKGKPNEKYTSFEAVYLDENKEQINKDFKAFLAFWEGFRWNKSTENFFKKYET